MRLWSLHPSYLDRAGLLALWREGLLARAVLRGATKGYRQHPQLARFRAHPAPLSAINGYLWFVVREAEARGYAFDKRKIGPVRDRTPLRVTAGQLAFEMEHLRRKLRSRTPERLSALDAPPVAHPLFAVVPGPIADWERAERPERG